MVLIVLLLTGIVWPKDDWSILTLLKSKLSKTLTDFFLKFLLFSRLFILLFWMLFLIKLFLLIKTSFEFKFIFSVFSSGKYLSVSVFKFVIFNFFFNAKILSSKLCLNSNNILFLILLSKNKSSLPFLRRLLSIFNFIFILLSSFWFLFSDFISNVISLLISILLFWSSSFISFFSTG